MHSLYHVTNISKSAQIAAYGVAPSYSEGKLMLSWYVDVANVPWAILHCMLRHNWSFPELTVAKVYVGAEEIRATAKKGLFTCDHTVTIAGFASPLDWFHDDFATK